MSLPQHIRVRCAEGHPLIFERPQSQPKAARSAMMLLTGFGWTVWIYLWRPALTLIVWFFGVDVAHYQWISLSGWQGLYDFALYTMPFGIALWVSLLIWASVNYIRFRGVDRRKERPPATLEADAGWTGVEAAVLARGRQVKNLVCQHDDEGHLIGITTEFSPINLHVRVDASKSDDSSRQSAERLANAEALMESET